MNPNSFRIDLLTQVLDTAALRHRVIAQNVANVNTPGYRRMEVLFEEDLAKSFESQAKGGSSDPHAAPHVQPKIVISDGPERVDGNTVDIDREMSDLSTNSLVYQAAAQILTHRLAALKSAIAGR